MNDAEKKDLGFLVKVLKDYEYSQAPPHDNQKEEGVEEVARYFVIGEGKKEVEERFEELFSVKEKGFRLYTEELRASGRKKEKGIYKLNENA